MSTSVSLHAGQNVIVWSPLWIGAYAYSLFVEVPGIVSISRVAKAGEINYYNSTIYTVDTVQTYIRAWTLTTSQPGFYIFPGDIVTIEVAADMELDYSPPMYVPATVKGFVWPEFWGGMSASALCAALNAAGASVLRVSYYDSVAMAWKSYLPAFSTPGSATDFATAPGLPMNVVSTVATLYGLDAVAIPTSLVIECLADGTPVTLAYQGNITIAGALYAGDVVLVGATVKVYIDNALYATLETDGGGSYAVNATLGLGTHVLRAEFEGAYL